MTKGKLAYVIGAMGLAAITVGAAVEAPVAMLRVYCSWPGVSAMMNLRLSVEKNR